MCPSVGTSGHAKLLRSYIRGSKQASAHCPRAWSQEGQGIWKPPGRRSPLGGGQPPGDARSLAQPPCHEGCCCRAGGAENPSVRSLPALRTLHPLRLRGLMQTLQLSKRPQGATDPGKFLGRLWGQRPLEQLRALPGSL